MAPPVSAELLRQAADRLDERADTEAILRAGDPYYSDEATSWEHLMSPTVGKALAAWLRDFADSALAWTDRPGAEPMNPGAPCLAVARAILGGDA